MRIVAFGFGIVLLMYACCSYTMNQDKKYEKRALSFKGYTLNTGNIAAVACADYQTCVVLSELDKDNGTYNCCFINYKDCEQLKRVEINDIVDRKLFIGKSAQSTDVIVPRAFGGIHVWSNGKKLSAKAIYNSPVNFSRMWLSKKEPFLYIIFCNQLISCNYNSEECISLGKMNVSFGDILTNSAEKKSHFFFVHANSIYQAQRKNSFQEYTSKELLSMHHKININSLVYSQRGYFFGIIADRQNSVYIMDVKNLTDGIWDQKYYPKVYTKELPSNHLSQVCSIAVHPNQRIFAFLIHKDEDWLISCVDITNFQEISMKYLTHVDGESWQIGQFISFSSDGTKMIVGIPGTQRFFDISIPFDINKINEDEAYSWIRLVKYLPLPQDLRMMITHIFLKLVKKNIKADYYAIK